MSIIDRIAAAVARKIIAHLPLVQQGQAVSVSAAPPSPCTMRCNWKPCDEHRRPADSAQERPDQWKRHYEQAVAQNRAQTAKMQGSFNDAVWRLECALVEAERAINQEIACAKTKLQRDRLMGTMVNIEALKKYSKKEEVSALAQRFGLGPIDFAAPDNQPPQGA